MSDWSKVTRPIPVPNEWTRPFWDAAKRGVVELQRCQSCGHFQHPPYPTCVNCMSIDLKFEPVEGKGAIVFGDEMIDAAGIRMERRKVAIGRKAGLLTDP